MSAWPVEVFEGPGSVTGMSFQPAVSAILFLFPIYSFAACTLVALANPSNWNLSAPSSNSDLATSSTPQNNDIWSGFS